MQLHVLAALAEFERARIAERVRTGLVRSSCTCLAQRGWAGACSAHRPEAGVLVPALDAVWFTVGPGDASDVTRCK